MNTAAGYPKAMTPDLESALLDGRMTVPERLPRVRVRELDAWCRENGRDPESLSESEIGMFENTR